MMVTSETSQDAKSSQRVTMWDKLHCEYLHAAVSAHFPRLVTVSDEDSLIREAPDSTILIMRGLEYTARTARMLSEADSKVRWIQLLSSGYDCLSLHGVPGGIIVTNSRGVYSTSVAQHAITLLLAITRCIPEMLTLQNEQRWASGYMRERMQPVEGRTLVVLGYGSLGQEVGRLGKALGMRVIGVKRRVTEERFADEILPVAKLQEALVCADALVISLPGSSETAGMIGARELALLPPHAVVVNVGRGNIIDTTALCDALHSRTIAGAALDVTDPEPLPPGAALWTCPNLIITPHVGGRSGPATAQRFASFVGDNLFRYLNG